MATALERQLLALRTKNRAGVQAKDRLGTASLLFSQKEAERLGVEHIYDIGVNGLLALAAKAEPRLKEFMSTLFSPDSPRVRRCFRRGFRTWRFSKQAL